MSIKIDCYNNIIGLQVDYSDSIQSEYLLYLDNAIKNLYQSNPGCFPELWDNYTVRGNNKIVFLVLSESCDKIQLKDDQSHIFSVKETIETQTIDIYKKYDILFSGHYLNIQEYLIGIYEYLKQYNICTLSNLCSRKDKSGVLKSLTELDFKAMNRQIYNDFPSFFKSEILRIRLSLTNPLFYKLADYYIKKLEFYKNLRQEKSEIYMDLYFGGEQVSDLIDIESAYNNALIIYDDYQIDIRSYKLIIRIDENSIKKIMPYLTYEHEVGFYFNYDSVVDKNNKRIITSLYTFNNVDDNILTFKPFPGFNCALNNGDLLSFPNFGWHTHPKTCYYDNINLQIPSDNDIHNLFSPLTSGKNIFSTYFGTNFVFNVEGVLLFQSTPSFIKLYKYCNESPVHIRVFIYYLLIYYMGVGYFCNELFNLTTGITNRILDLDTIYDFLLENSELLIYLSPNNDTREKITRAIDDLTKEGLVKFLKDITTLLIRELYVKKDIQGIEDIEDYTNIIRRIFYNLFVMIINNKSTITEIRQKYFLFRSIDYSRNNERVEYIENNKNLISSLDIDKIIFKDYAPLLQLDFYPYQDDTSTIEIIGKLPYTSYFTHDEFDMIKPYIYENSDLHIPLQVYNNIATYIKRELLRCFESKSSETIDINSAEFVNNLGEKRVEILTKKDIDKSFISFIRCLRKIDKRFIISKGGSRILYIKYS